MDFVAERLIGRSFLPGFGGVSACLQLVELRLNRVVLNLLEENLRLGERVPFGQQREAGGLPADGARRALGRAPADVSEVQHPPEPLG